MALNIDLLLTAFYEFWLAKEEMEMEIEIENRYTARHNPPLSK
jgi:hypothetical protein